MVLFSPLILNAPVTFGIIYVLLFSATKQVGALLFSITFLTASTIVPKERVRNSMLLSAIGIVMLFGSIEIVTLQYRLFPPFGLITEAFMPLGSFLLFAGIFTSATSVAQDAQLRGDFYKSAESQLSLLKTIGVTQMEKELVKKFKHMEKRAIASGETDEPYQEEEDIKQIVREVLNELNKTKEQA
jgi:ABC-type multidrug transport system fused ATPase/permease subunit